MKKRCFFIGTPGGTGAVASHFCALGRELAARGHEVKFLIPRADAAASPGGGNPELLVWPSARPTGLRDALFLAKLIRRFRPDCFMANFAAVNWMCVVGWLLRVEHRNIFYHTLRSQIEFDLRNTSRLKLNLLRFRKRFVFRLATGLLANSSAGAEDLLTGYGVPESKCTVQYLGLADPCVSQPMLPVEAREDTVLCVGRLHPSKGQDILIDAIAGLEVPANGTGFHFLGKGPALSDLQKRATEKGVADRCVFEGALKHAEVLSRMSRAKAVVVPSRTEAFGLVNVEAISMATPVVAARVGGIPEIVRDGEEGLLFAPGDAASLTEKLATLLCDVELRKRLGNNGRDRYLRTFELKQRVKNHARFLEDSRG